VLVETHPDKPVLIVNPTSGGGTASHYDLVGQCRARGIDAVVFERGDDLSALAAAAIEGGAEVIGIPAVTGHRRRSRLSPPSTTFSTCVSRRAHATISRSTSASHATT
jgi:hypothetical protein